MSVARKVEIDWKGQLESNRSRIRRAGAEAFGPAHSRAARALGLGQRESGGSVQCGMHSVGIVSAIAIAVGR